MIPTSQDIETPATAGGETGATDEDADSCCCSVSTLHPAFDDDRPARLRDRITAASQSLRLGQTRLSIVVVGDTRMAELHELHRDEAGTTDVLSFDLNDNPNPPHPAGRAALVGLCVEGEIVVCHDEAARQAADRGHGVDDELTLYALHGLLHLLGYDDHDPAEHARMHTLEDDLLEVIGVGRVYARTATG